MEFKGDVKIKRTLIADRRVDQGLAAKAISGVLAILRHDHAWLNITATGAQDVTLPDATTLPNGWEIVLNALAGGNLTVKDGGAGGTLQIILAGIAGNAFRFVLLDNGSAEGEWYIQTLDNAGAVVATRFVLIHDASGDWTGPTSGYYHVDTDVGDHGRGTNPSIQFYEDVGSGVLNQVQPDKSELQTNGDHAFFVPDDPDLRYAGQVVFI